MTFNIGKRVAFLRKINNQKTQYQLGKEIFLSQAHVANLEIGRYPFSNELIQNLSIIFDVPQSYFEPVQKNCELDRLLENTFETMFSTNIESLAELFSTKTYDFEINQEVAFRLLQTVYYYKNNQFDNCDNNLLFISTFIEDDASIQNNPTILKYYFLYAYQLNFHKNKLDKCYHYCKLLFESVESEYLKGKILILMAQTLYRNGLMSEALVSISEAIKFIEKFDEELLLSSAYVTLSSVLIHFKNYGEALKILTKIEDINKEHYNEDFLSVLLQHRGLIFKKKKAYPKAIDNYEKAYHIAKNTHNQIRILISLIICNLKAKNLEEATKYLERLRNKQLRKHEKMVLFSLECELQLYNNSLDEHKDQLKTVLKYFEQNNYIADLKYIYSYLANYYSEKKMYKQATKYFIKKEKLEDE